MVTRSATLPRAKYSGFSQCQWLPRVAPFSLIGEVEARRGHKHSEGREGTITTSVFSFFPLLSAKAELEKSRSWPISYAHAKHVTRKFSKHWMWIWEILYLLKWKHCLEGKRQKLEPHSSTSMASQRQWGVLIGLLSMSTVDSYWVTKGLSLSSPIRPPGSQCSSCFLPDLTRALWMPCLSTTVSPSVPVPQTCWSCSIL